jgi:hypothetical protein
LKLPSSKEPASSAFLAILADTSGVGLPLTAIIELRDFS